MDRRWIASALAALLGLAGCAPPVEVQTAVPTPTLKLWVSPTPTRTSTPWPTPSGAVEGLGPTPTPFVHTIQAGDQLLMIAARYGVSLEDLLIANPGIDPQFLIIGQQIRIPTEGGAPVEALLPTPTPMSLETSAPRCYESLTGVVRCLVLVTNPHEGAIEGITALFELLDEQGARIAAQEAHAPLRRLEPRARVPLMAVFTERGEAPPGVRVALLAATGSVPEAPSFVPAEIRVIRWENQGHSAVIAGEVLLGPDPAEAPPSAVDLRILALALDPHSQIAGFRVWEELMEAFPEGGYAFEMTVFSLGPEIGKIEMAVEVERLD